MKLLDKLVLRELRSVFGFSLAMFFVLVFAGGPLLKASTYLAQGVSPGVVLKLLGLSIPWVVGLTIPIGTLLAMLITYGRLSSDSEVVALYSGGVPIARIIAPAIAVGLCISVLGYLINDHIETAANRQVDKLQNHLLHEPGQTTHSIDWEERKHGVLVAVVHVEKGFDIHTQTMRQVLITLYHGKGAAPVAVIYADTAKWQGGTRWQLANVDIMQPGKSSFTHFDTFDSTRLDSSLVVSALLAGRMRSAVLSKTPDEVAFLGSDVATFDFSALYRQIVHLKESGLGETMQVRDAEVQLWSKLAWPLASLVFAMTGAVLGMRTHNKSKNTGWLLAVGILFSYHVLYMVMQSVAASGYWPAAPAVFLPDLLFGLGAIYLIWIG